MGKGARQRRQQQGRPPSSAAARRLRSAAGEPVNLRAAADNALARLLQTNPPGKISFAGAYALGYAALGLAHQEGNEPEWLLELDPLDTLFLGTAFPHTFHHGYEFANARTAWLRLLRGTAYWRAIERFVREVLHISEEHDLPVDDRELMLLLAARLEVAGLDQRKLPRDLLADRALAGAVRLAFGPGDDLKLPEPPPDAAKRVADIWMATDAKLPEVATASDALRMGLHLMASSRPGIRRETTVLLPALYIGLVAGKYGDRSKAGERSVAWALGLCEDSPLVPVTDVLLVASKRGLDSDTTLSHVFGLPAFTEPVSVEDRRWHSWPGRALVDLAFELGYPQVTTRQNKVIHLERTGTALFEAQVRRFEQKFGRSPAANDPLFFDSDADQPQSFSSADLEAITIDMLESAGISQAWIYAFRHTGGLLPRPDGSFGSERDRNEWNEAVGQYIKAHGPADYIGHEDETQKFQNALVIVTLHMAIDDPEYGAALADQVTAADIQAGSDVGLVRQYLHFWASSLGSTLRSERAILSGACEYASAWAADLPDRVRDAAKTPTDSVIPNDVLLAVAIAVMKDSAL